MIRGENEGHECCRGMIRNMQFDSGDQQATRGNDIMRLMFR